MKKTNSILIILVVLFAAIFILSYNYFKNSTISNDVEESVLVNNAEKPIYHFAVICQDIDEHFWQDVKKGTQEASVKFNAAIEFNGPKFTNMDEELQFLDIAIASKVDGIVTHVLDEEKFAPLIDKAAKNNIPVVTIESDAKSSKRVSFVGINGYKLGAEGGKLVVEATGKNGVVAIIPSSSKDSGGNTILNLKIKGFIDAVKDFPFLKVKTMEAGSYGSFSAEEVAKDILNNYPDVNAIFCTSAKDTVGVAQVLVDMNKVGIAIIGYDDTPDILKYIEKGVIYGTVANDPVKMGYESIKALVEIREQNRISDYIYTGVNVITEKNVKDFISIYNSDKGQDASK